MDDIVDYNNNTIILLDIDKEEKEPKCSYFDIHRQITESINEIEKSINSNGQIDTEKLKEMSLRLVNNKSMEIVDLVMNMLNMLVKKK